MAYNAGELKKVAQRARRRLREEVGLRLDQALKTDSAELRQQAAARNELRQQIAQTSNADVIDRVAYTWFNRFCALRFMDVNYYNSLRVVSPAPGASQPEVLQEAKQGYIQDGLLTIDKRQMVFDLLSGKTPARDPQQEAYRLLLTGVCNAWHKSMPFLFEEIANYTELLMPPDLLSEQSILTELCAALDEEACQDVEVIGWLYQYYISERKDEIFADLKLNQKIEAQDIPAATQLFTPHWIVRYLVENSLGRLWLLNRPDSRLAEKMDYYIQPSAPENDFLKITSPEEIRLCDPACGSGHMLTYAFDLLAAIYEEAGYPPQQIPALILKHNLYGIEIDPRAGALAAFALFMKARARDTRFFERGVTPNICVLENLSFTQEELDDYMDAVGRDLFSFPLSETLKQFEQATHFGSLIRPALTDTAPIRQQLSAQRVDENLFLHDIHVHVLKALDQAEYLSPRYHVVVANPPYMGGKGMNEELKVFAAANFPDSKQDLFAMFIERGFDLIMFKGYNAMVTMESWMFLSSFEKLRMKLLATNTIECMVHMDNMVMGIAFGTAATIWIKAYQSNYKAHYSFIEMKDISDGNKPYQFPVDNERLSVTSASDFKKIPGSPIAYWISGKKINVYTYGSPLSDIAQFKAGLSTGNNEIFQRYWFEIVFSEIGFGYRSIEETGNGIHRWFPCNSGGEFRKWASKNEWVVDWELNGQRIKTFKNKKGNSAGATRNTQYYFRNGLTWNKISSSNFSVKYKSPGFIFDDTSRSAFIDDNSQLYYLLAFLCSKVCFAYLKLLNPSMSFTNNDLERLPIIVIPSHMININKRIEENISISCTDSNSFETSWDFTRHPLRQFGVSLYRGLGDVNDGEPLPQSEIGVEKTPLGFRMAEKDAPKNFTIRSAFEGWQEFAERQFCQLKANEEELNRIFIEIYGLGDELTPEVADKDITVTRIYDNKADIPASMKGNGYVLTKSDVIQSFISYAVGCMLGRYSLDRDGVAYAGGAWDESKYQSFPPTQDNVLIISAEPYFAEDIVEHFVSFVREVYGAKSLEENLTFIADALGVRGDTPRVVIRTYFLKNFFKDHCKTYQKRPIYWQFSSPQGSFNALIYLHRYNRDTISVILNRYLREFAAKLETQRTWQQQISIRGDASEQEKSAATREIQKLDRTLVELRTYERDVLYPLAAQRIEIDLNDGVKVNYAKFGAALAKI